jgi:hypothetical protein
MNIITHQSLIVGHNDIRESPLMLFVRDLIAINHFADRSGGVWQMRFEAGSL